MVIMEAHQVSTNQQELQEWAGENDYLAVRTEPPKQMENDYRKTEVIPTMCVFVLIDLNTMRVLESNCGQVVEEQGDECIEKHL